VCEIYLAFADFVKVSAKTPDKIYFYYSISGMVQGKPSIAKT
jgi:hypothetical protein